MTLGEDDLAGSIVRAHAEGRLLTAPAGHGLDPDAAYRVQSRVNRARWPVGSSRAGWKLGYTSAAMRAQMGIDTPNLGPLSDLMILQSGSPIPPDVVQPRVEPEIAAVIARDVEWPMDGDRLAECVAEWRLALEVVDSVWEGYRFDWALNTADGSSAAYVVLGAAVPFADLAETVVTLSVDGSTVEQGRASEAMGHPVDALAWLAAQLHERGDRLRAGDVVITGGLTRAVPFEPGSVIRACAGDASVDARRVATA